MTPPNAALSTAAPAKAYRVMGVDPGSIHTGYGIIDLAGTRIELVTAGRISSDPKTTMPERLKNIFERLGELIETHKPMAMSLETIYTGINPQSAFKLAEARGVVVLCSAIAGLPLLEYAPGTIKLSVCGYGTADKAQVAFMARKILKTEEAFPPDATDALAIAITHANNLSLNSINYGPGRANVLSGEFAKGRETKNFRKLSVSDLQALGFKIDGAKE
ncbi:MAG: crossover junction endodeoxyribonuclease RuvC [Deltaproteobacteria bacterium]|jgi:crossover junction endodeoxyribonuclease RuvC|nr:crossover junction endodeoxyribonuclease RuvC [Deltaproteobacteria bacterium]